MTEQELRKVDTRERLLDAAAEIYAEQGYRNARVRDICDRAGANIAAINYHFGDKQGLYDAAVRHAFLGLSGGDPASWDLGENVDTERRLYAFVKSFLTQLLSDGRSALYAKLVAREMFEPTTAFKRMLEDGIRPQVEIVISVVRDVLGEEAEEQHVRRCAGSILGQCLYYYFAKPVILTLPLEEKLDAESIDALARHITRFSLVALRQLANEQRDGVRP